MMLGAVHRGFTFPQKWQSHQLLDDGDGIFGFFCKANANNAVHALRMALAADIVTVLTDRFAVFYFMADSAGL